MLDQIRKNVRHPYIQVLLGLIIVVFILFFGWSMRSQPPNYVAKVNGDTIDFRSYQQAYNGLVSIYQEAYKNELNSDRIRQLGLGRRALDQLVDRTLLQQEASRRGIRVADDEVRGAIEGLSVFQEAGSFSKPLYVRVLEANRLTPLEYETSKKLELQLQRVEASIRAEASVSDAEVDQEYRDRNNRVVVDYASFSPAAFEPEVKPTEEALADFFQAEAETFRRPERRAARYVLFAPEAYTGAVEVTEQELRDEYAWRAEEFQVKEAVRARHLLVRVAPDAGEGDRKAAREKIQKLRQQIEGGKPFADVARKSSEDPGTKDQGGDLGLFERGRMVPEFEQAAFALEPGKVSDPVETSFGYHLILVEEHRPASQKAFEDVQDTLAGEIRRRKAMEQTYAAADNVLMDLEDGKTTWEKLAAEREVKTSDIVPEGGAVSGVEKPAEFTEALFAIGKDKAGELIETGAGTYLFAAASVEPSSIPPLAEVKDELAARFRKVEAKRLAEARAKEFLAAATEDWGDGVKKFGAVVETTEPFAKKGGAVPKIGWAPALKEAVFSLGAPGDVAAEAFDVNGAYYVVRLAEKEEADLSNLEAEREQLRAELLPTKQEEHFQARLDELRKKAEITVNEDLLF